MATISPAFLLSPAAGALLHHATKVESPPCPLLPLPPIESRKRRVWPERGHLTPYISDWNNEASFTARARRTTRELPLPLREAGYPSGSGRAQYPQTQLAGDAPGTGSSLSSAGGTDDLASSTEFRDLVTADEASAGKIDDAASDIEYVSIPVIQPLPGLGKLTAEQGTGPGQSGPGLAGKSSQSSEPFELRADMALPLEDAGAPGSSPGWGAQSGDPASDRDRGRTDYEIEYISIPVIQALPGVKFGEAEETKTASLGDGNLVSPVPPAALDAGAPGAPAELAGTGPANASAGSSGAVGNHWRIAEPDPGMTLETSRGSAQADEALEYISWPLIQSVPGFPQPGDQDVSQSAGYENESVRLTDGAIAGASQAKGPDAVKASPPAIASSGQVQGAVGGTATLARAAAPQGQPLAAARDPAASSSGAKDVSPALSVPLASPSQGGGEVAGKSALGGLPLAVTVEPSQPGPVAINPYGRTIELSMPLKGGNRVLGEVPVRLGMDNRVAVKKEPLLGLLQSAVTNDFRARLAQLPDDAGYLFLDQVGSAGMSLTYDQVQVALLVDLPGTAAATRDIPLVGSFKEVVGVFDQAARVSGYLNLRSALGFDTVNGGPDNLRPLFDMSGALRIGPVVLETDLSAEFGGQAGVLRRSFTRAVYDMPDSRLRISVGDVFTPGQSFLSTPDVLGISIEREDRLFDPQRNLQSQRFEQFSLTEQSQVEVLLNGSVVRRLTLNPGNYRLTDFPFVSGGNDVEIIAVDRFGRREIANFSRFVSFNLLPAGQDEFAGAAGIQAITGQASRSYQFSRYTAYGSYRRGINDYFTLGGSVVADTETVSAGAEATLGLPIGNLQLEAAATQDKIAGLGYTARALYTWTPSSQDRMLSGLAFSLEFISPGFTQVGRQAPSANTVALITSASAAFQLSEESFVTLGANYSSGRGQTADRYEFSAQYSQRLGRSTNVSMLAGYGTTGTSGQGGLLVQIGIARRFGPRGFGSARYTNRDDTLRMSYNSSGGRGVGATVVAP